MSRLEVPVKVLRLWSTGDWKLWTDVELWLKDCAGGFHRQRFRVDTGTQLTTFPAYDANQLGLPLPAAASPVTFSQTGLEVRSGVLGFRVDGMDATEYAAACLFLGDPNTPPDPNQPAAFPRKLLQPFGLLDQRRFQVDKDPLNMGAPHKVFIVEKKAP